MRHRLTSKLGRFDDQRTLARAETIPASWYRDGDIYDLERRVIFGDTWQAVGRADQVAEPGQFFAVGLAGEPVVVVRGEDGELRAMSNVCRHRAARVVESDAGTVSRLRCRYHGWTYDLAGQLRGTPDFEGVENFRREEQGLPRFACATWGPFVWVHLGESAPPLDSLLAPLIERSAGLGIDELRFVERREYVLECNWKVFVDNYLDGGYHVNTIHPGLAGALDYSGYHTEVFELASLQSSPLKAAEPSDPGTAPTDAHAQSEPLRTVPDWLTRMVRTGANAYYWWLFPNFMINLYQGVMDTNLVLPLGANRCHVVFDFYFASAEPEFIRESISVADQIQREDATICEEVQRGLGSRTFDTGRYSVRREAAVYHFHRLLARRLINAPAAVSSLDSDA